MQHCRIACYNAEPHVIEPKYLGEVIKQKFAVQHAIRDKLNGMERKKRRRGEKEDFFFPLFVLSRVQRERFDIFWSADLTKQDREGGIPYQGEKEKRRGESKSKSRRDGALAHAGGAGSPVHATPHGTRGGAPNRRGEEGGRRRRAPCPCPWRVGGWGSVGLPPVAYA